MESENDGEFCEPIARWFGQFGDAMPDDVGFETRGIRVAELFAGVGGFRIGLEKASPAFHTVWSNQWEPSTKRQDASVIYMTQFGRCGHVNRDISTIDAGEIPDVDVLVGGFPCQDYSVAATLKNSGGIEGKKGVLWWQIHRILRDKGDAAPRFLVLENVDRLLTSPAKQRGRDFAIILASLSDLGYSVEWRVVNAADYGMPQRRKRTYIVAYRGYPNVGLGFIARAFPCSRAEGAEERSFSIVGSLDDVTRGFNVGNAVRTPFRNSGLMCGRNVVTVDVEPSYAGIRTLLGDVLVPDADVPREFFIADGDVEKWAYLKGPKSIDRKAVGDDGTEYTYRYSEGGMAFPDSLEKTSRTIITGEGGYGPSRFKHVVRTSDGRLRRLTPVELERLDMFPDNHTIGASDSRRAFLCGNAFVTGCVFLIGREIAKFFRGWLTPR